MTPNAGVIFILQPYCYHLSRTFIVDRSLRKILLIISVYFTLLELIKIASFSFPPKTFAEMFAAMFYFIISASVFFLHI